MNIGEKYLVPTVELPIGNKNITFVVLHQHVSDIGNEDHQHLDLRFISGQDLEYIKRYYGEDFLIEFRACEPRPVTMREMVLHRQHVQIKFFGDSRPSFMKLQKMAEKFTKTCDKCPHQGCDLSEAPVTKVGAKKVVVCPCHGLRWSLDTGELVKRIPRKSLKSKLPALQVSEKPLE
jgi:nitrite reductase/ring-hydroxylating ferredoxin subunit